MDNNLEHRYLAQAGADNAYGDYRCDDEAIRDFSERFPRWDYISIWDEDLRIWKDIATR